MRSKRAKVLHEIAGKAMIHHVLDNLERLRPERTIVIVGHQADAVREAVSQRAQCVLQDQQLGTGDAVRRAGKALRGFDGDVLVLCGDVPLLTTTTLRRLLREHRKAGGALATALAMVADDPTGYGRVLQGEDGFLRIVEHGDATAQERLVDEVNTGTYCFEADFLFRALRGLGRQNVQGEYYLTDVLEAASNKAGARCVVLEDDSEGSGVNSRADLARAEALVQERLILHWMDRGVTFLDPTTTYLSSEVRIGMDTVLGPSVRLEGMTTLGRACHVDGVCHLIDTRVADGVHLRWGVVSNGARITSGAIVGPYSHLRPGAVLAEGVHVGNFVEVKNSRIGRRSKANHLAYVGDATVGEDVNIGAGTITCNYDGFSKHRTVIGDRVQIGSDTQLVAPVELAADVYVAAGSTVSRDVEAGALVFNDKRQQVRSGWVAAFRARQRKKKS